MFRSVQNGGFVFDVSLCHRDIVISCLSKLQKHKNDRKDYLL